MKKLLVIPLLFLSFIALCQPASVKTRPLKDSNVFIANTLYVDRAVSLATPTDASLSFSDILTNNASITKHGFLPKLPNDATKYLNGLGNWVTVTVSPGIDDVLAQLQQLTTARKIRMGGQTLTLDSGQLRFTNMSDPAIVLDPFPKGVHTTQYLLRMHTASASNPLSYEMLVDNNINGGPPDDNIFIEGWNIDSRTISTLPSFTQRMESMYGGTGWEYHIQFSNPVAGTLYRLISLTFADHGNPASDVNLEFHKVTGFELRPLINDAAVWSVGVGSTLTFIQNTMSTANTLLTISSQLNSTSNFYTIAATSGTPHYLLDGFDYYQFGGGNQKVLINPNTNTISVDNLVTAKSDTLTFDTGTGNVSWLIKPSIPGKFKMYFSTNTGEWTDVIANSGYVRQFQLANGTNLFTMGPIDATFNENVTLSGSHSFLRVNTDGTNNTIGTLFFPVDIVNNSAWYTGIHQKNANSGGVSYNIIENNRGSFASYIVTGYGGSSTGGLAQFFGMNCDDMGTIQTGGASNLGFVYGTNSNTPIYIGTNNIIREKILGNGVHLMLNTRFQMAKGANVASATNMTLGLDGNVFHITGTTTINNIITTSWQAGSEIILIFDASVTVKNNTVGGGGTALLLAGGVDFSATANDVLKIEYDGTSIFEESRSVN